MSRSRHKERAAGGAVKPVWNAGGGQNAAKEAEERKRGGKVHHMKGEGHKGKHHMDRKARGGKVGHKHHEGPGRKRGGGIGANLTPLSTAARIKEVTKGEYAEDSPKND